MLVEAVIVPVPEDPYVLISDPLVKETFLSEGGCAAMESGLRFGDGCDSLTPLTAKLIVWFNTAWSALSCGEDA